MKQDFRNNKNETSAEKIVQFYNKGVHDLGVITRQSIISLMYAHKLHLMDASPKDVENIAIRGPPTEKQQQEDD